MFQFLANNAPHKGKEYNFTVSPKWHTTQKENMRDAPLGKTTP
jgi:hypothetical protein